MQLGRWPWLASLLQRRQADGVRFLPAVLVAVPVSGRRGDLDDVRPVRLTLQAQVAHEDLASLYCLGSRVQACPRHDLPGPSALYLAVSFGIPKRLIQRALP